MQTIPPAGSRGSPRQCLGLVGKLFLYGSLTIRQSQVFQRIEAFDHAFGRDGPPSFAPLGDDGQFELFEGIGNVVGQLFERHVESGRFSGSWVDCWIGRVGIASVQTRCTIVRLTCGTIVEGRFGSVRSAGLWRARLRSVGGGSVGGWLVGGRLALALFLLDWLGRSGCWLLTA